MRAFVSLGRWGLPSERGGRVVRARSATRVGVCARARVRACVYLLNRSRATWLQTVSLRRLHLLLSTLTTSGQHGTGEFIVTILVMGLSLLVFFWKMTKFVYCPDRLERKRRREVLLKQFLMAQNAK